MIDEINDPEYEKMLLDFRRPKDTVDFDKLFLDKPKHQNCSLVMKLSGNTKHDAGLYCVEHSCHLAWINLNQVIFCLNLGIPAEFTLESLRNEIKQKHFMEILSSNNKPFRAYSKRKTF